jgi:PAS domain S-box-containing protein
VDFAEEPPDLPEPPQRTALPALPVSTWALRLFFGGMAASLGMGGLLLATLQPEAAGALPTAGLFAGLGVLAAAGTRLPKAALMPAMLALLFLLVPLLVGSAVVLGWGLASPVLASLALAVCVLCTAAGWRAALALTLVSALALAAVPWLGAAASGTVLPPVAMQLGALWLVLAVGLASGVVIWRASASGLWAAQAREQRYRSLLALAVDAYWEIDAQYRLRAAHLRDESHALRPDTGLGAVPWELPRFACEPDALDELLADLDARRSFRDVAVGWSRADGNLRQLLVSGEPRFNERGVFQGYWGVARDITAESAAREALTATEIRYQELFARIPTPLVLHRHGRVFDANPAALQLFGVPDLDTMVARDLLSAYEDGDSRERARRRMNELQTLPVGSALPVTDFRLLVHGRQLLVRTTGVRVHAVGGPATLSIYVDDTERQAAEESVRRSEVMLSHLVATSPDLITLTEMVSGRYVMVNQAFERTMGHSVAEAKGRTALELGVWKNAEERTRFVNQLLKEGQVTDLPVSFMHKRGEPVSMRVSAARLVMDRRDYVVINARDVTESERAQLEREAILANASVGIAVTRQSRFVLANRCFEDMFGWAPGELLGQSGAVVWSSAKEHVDLGAQIGPQLARGEPVTMEREACRRDGSRFVGRFQARAVDPAQPALGGTVWIAEDVTDRRQFERALAQARDDAEAASRAKSAFLANTSHELRTPLNGMIGLAQLARQPDLGEALRRQYLEQIAESAQSLTGIISDILDLSKIEAGRLELVTSAFDLGELLRSLQRTYGTLATAHGLALRLELGDGLHGLVQGDSLRVRQICTNFLTNALKFTTQGEVVLAAAREGEWVRIDVRDTGGGIDDETQSRLFRPFTQADESTTRRFGGTGLGLSICRELATLMGGTVGVHSQPGTGSTFWAKLPLSPVEAAQGGAAPTAEGRLEGARVLLVEDNAVNMVIATAMLERWGVQVEQAENGSFAVAAVQSAADAGQPFDAVLMDVQMPVMSGHEATRALRDCDAGRHLPVIALTAAALVTERDEALASGMNDFLTKPIDAERLRSTLARWAGKQV